jgi:alpha-glucosidase
VTEQLEIIHPADADNRWWRKSVIYQVYPKSFKDHSGDGIGDLNGVTEGLGALSELGVDAVWLSPFYNSPQKDGGYDVSDYCSVDPMFGTCDDFKNMAAHAESLGIKTIIDIVPNHCSNEHVMFQAALIAEPGSAERAMFIFRDGKGDDGELPPNNWQSHFGGSAWTRVIESDGKAGQWYLHLFDTSQPDWNWDNPAVHAEFERILRFWLDLGLSGFRVDVAHALIKKEGLPDWGGKANGKSSEGFPGYLAPMFGQESVHNIFRSWRKILDEYPGERILCAEANVDPVERIADWVREDAMHQAFNFHYLNCQWGAAPIRKVITDSLASFDSVGAPTTWVLSNHDKVRHTTRMAMNNKIGRHGDGIGPDDVQPDTKLGLTRGRASTLMMLALPGGVYLYQGEELGLPDNTTMAPQFRQDPTFYRTNGERIGRDGCRVPLPWTENNDSFGFSVTGQAWLPQPLDWAEYSREAQEKNADSTLNLYKKALLLRKERNLGGGSFAWMPGYSDGDVVAFVNGKTLVLMNMGTETATIPTFPVLLSSEGFAGDNGYLEADHAVWMELP